MAADWTHTEFDAAVDELRSSSVPDFELTPADWRSKLRKGTAVDVFRARIAPFSARFSPRQLQSRREQQGFTRHLHDLGTAVLGQWDRTCDRRALRIAFLPSRPNRLLGLAEALQCRYEHTGDRAALVEAVARYREAASGVDTRQRALEGLGRAQTHVYELTRDRGVLDDSIPSEVVAPSRQPQPGRPLARAATLTDTAATQLADYLRTGDSLRFCGPATRCGSADRRLAAVGRRDRGVACRSEVYPG